MYFSIQILKISGHWKRRQKAERLIKDVAKSDSENKNFDLFTPGLYILDNNYIEIRENTFAFDLLEIIEKSKIEAEGFASVYDSDFEINKDFMAIDGNLNLNDYVNYSIFIPRKKEDYFITIFKDFKNKDIVFSFLTNIIKITPSNVDKISEIFNEMMNKLKEVKQKHANNYKEK